MNDQVWSFSATVIKSFSTGCRLQNRKIDLIPKKPAEPGTNNGVKVDEEDLLARLVFSACPALFHHVPLVGASAD
ncbi:MAG TPA: hypothetical protein VMU69_06490 [Bradyrhizobium sp.]|nr:hypothetical protein [Bradyrhizobium sp.]